jgi:hypothetical protein
LPDTPSAWCLGLGGDDRCRYQVITDAQVVQPPILTTIPLFVNFPTIDLDQLLLLAKYTLEANLRSLRPKSLP